MLLPDSPGDVLDCFDPDITNAVGRFLPGCQDIVVQIKYKLNNPNGFDMWVIVGDGDAKTKLLFDGTDVTPETNLFNKMVIKADSSHIVLLKKTINTCEPSYNVEMKMKLKPIDPVHGFANVCKSIPSEFCYYDWLIWFD